MKTSFKRSIIRRDQHLIICSEFLQLRESLLSVEEHFKTGAKVNFYAGIKMLHINREGTEFLGIVRTVFIITNGFYSI